MTWTKTTDTFPRDARRAKLSSDAYRLHHEGLTWVNHLESGPGIDGDDLGVLSGIRPLSAAEAAADELVRCGWWTDLGSGWELREHYRDQIEPDVLARRREADRERQRRKRAKAAGIDPDTGEVLPPPAPSRPVSRRDDPRDDTRDPGRVGSGRAGTGKDSLEGDQESWPEVAHIPRERPWRDGALPVPLDLEVGP